MRLTTVGTGTAAPSPTRVQPAHLLEAGDARILLDCGSGAVHRLASLGLEWMSITHLALTHFHADHIADVATLLQAWRWGALPARSAPVEVLGPAGTQAHLELLERAFGVERASLGYEVTVRELPPGADLELAEGLRVATRKVPHTPESIAYSISRNGARLVYTGDTGFDAGIADWASGADVMLCECSLPASMAIPQHLTPEQCGELAALAAPRTLVLTHFYPPVESVDIAAVVAARFSGAMVLARDGWSIEI